MMSQYNPNIHHRRSIRLKGYDYSQEGLYFITICCQDRICRFGEIKDGKMILNDAGKMAVCEWEKLPERFPQIILHDYILMPNHFHAILEIGGAIEGACPRGCPIPCDCPNDSDNFGMENEEKNGNNNIIIRRPQGSPVSPSPSIVEEIDEKIVGAIPCPIHRGCPNDNNPRKIALGEILGAFQSIVTVNYIRGVKENKYPPFDKKLWQRNYYEHIIRNQEAYDRISNYIQNNPINWKKKK